MPVVRAEANNEQLARSHFLNWNLVFAAQIRTHSLCRLQLMDGGARFSDFELLRCLHLRCSGGGVCLNSPELMRYRN
ncbi:hypothetical protein KCP76_16660 [Salmonella enterica subsp. enterica serovar Weltevreden]|nr:hypothetical protein KCP76_16660 [Salmonella enterica subsp. enterica serovar Weltevreden]